MRKILRAVMIAILAMVFNLSAISANPVSPEGITEFSVDPDWIEVDNSHWSLESTFIVDGKEVIINWEKVLNNSGVRAVFDSTNTSGFDLKPEGGSIFFPAIHDTLFYGSSQMYPSPLPGESIAFYDEWHYSHYLVPWNFDPTPTPKALNDAPATKFGNGTVFLNEVFPGVNGVPAFVELYNRGDTIVDIGGYFLISGARFKIPTGTMIQAHGFFLLNEKDFPKRFSISSFGGTIYLQNNNYELIDQMGWPAGLDAGISLNRIPDGFATVFQGYDYSTSIDFREGQVTPGNVNTGLPLISISIERDRSLLCPGALKQYYCRGINSVGHSARIPANWSITDIGSVNSAGLIEGVRCGNGVLTAVYESLSDTMQVRGAIGGMVTNDVVWKKEYSPYFVEENAFFNILQIEPGTELKFTRYCRIGIHGLIKAIGNENNPIRFIFTGSLSDRPYAGVSISTSIKSVLRYCTFENFNIAIFLEHSASNTEISNCTFLNNLNSLTVYGISIVKNNLLIGTSTNQQPNPGILVYAPQSAKTQVSNNIIINCDKGISIGETSDVIIRNNIVFNCTTGIDGSADIAYNCINAPTPFTNGPESAGILSTTNSRGAQCDRYQNIFLNPGFVNTVAGDYHLTADSPCIDSGDPSILDKNNSVSDMGMYGGGDIVPIVQNTSTDIHPRELRIERNYPNPFNPSTTIIFTLPKEGLVRLTVYNITGGKVRDLVSSSLPAGRHEVRWQGVDDRGNALSSGVYLMRLSQGQTVSTGKILLMK
jgi:parallel beta-helix repeat protein